MRLAIPIRVVCHVERECAAVEILLARMQEGALDEAPIWDDLCTFDGRTWRGRVDLVAAGFPCQPVSIAGKRRGTADHRWLWDDVWRITRDVDARLLFVENVSGLLGRQTFDLVLGSLAASGWSAEWDCVPASSVGAPHERDRVFLLAADPGRLGVETGNDLRRPGGETITASDRGAGLARPPSDADGSRLQPERIENERASAHRNVPDGRYGEAIGWAGRPAPEPCIRGVDDGLANSVDGDRLHVAGNGVVPQAAAQAFRVLAARLFGEAMT